MIISIYTYFQLLNVPILMTGEQKQMNINNCRRKSVATAILNQGFSVILSLGTK